VKRIFSVALGVLTAIGGFVDIGDLVTNGTVGSRFGMSLSWVVVAGVLGICVFAEMSGRVVAVSGRPTFDIVRERLGPRMGLANLFGSIAVTLLTFIAEIGGVALTLELVTSVYEYLWVPVVAALVWIVLWRAKFSLIENVFGLVGLALVVFAVAMWRLGPDWGQVVHQAVTVAKPAGVEWSTMAYFAVALFGAAMTPYEVFFFSSGGVEEHWDASSIRTMRMNVFIGFPLGGLLSLAIAGVATLTLLPAGIQVSTLGQISLPVAIALGKIGFGIVCVGFFAATFGAACETGLSVGYSIGQYFGWQWGKYVRPREAARFHLVLLLSTVLAGLVLLTTIDPILVTEASVVFSALALPLTYLPILIVANDREYMGDHRNRLLANSLGTIYLVAIVVASVAAVPLMVITKMGNS
jgi:Mn2+/Fe2+ NRAMP family transporter